MLDLDDGSHDVPDYWPALDALMARDGFWPNVWWISDHGNAHLLIHPA